jgi:pimeloyl-ACP methyl ester carboxylesterase
MPQLDRDGVGIDYEVHGEGEPLLLSHGYSATSRMWEKQVEALSDRYRVVTWDMRGHGRSDSPGDVTRYSEELTVGDMAALLDEIGARQAIVGGLSLGGYMSLAFHHRHPERVRALLLFDTGPGYKSDAARAEWNANAERRAVALETQGLAALGGRPQSIAGTAPRAGDALPSAEVAASQHRSAKGLALAARGMLAQRDDHVIRSLPEIRVPTLVVVGADDTPFHAATDYMAAKIPGARKVVIPGAGHAANIDQPEAFNRAVLEYLDSLGAAAAQPG